MGMLRNSSIRKKLTILCLVATVAALLIVCCAFFTADYITFRRMMVDSLLTHAEMLGNNSTAALQFDDSKNMVEMLSSLRAEHSVMGASIFDARGEKLASYVREGMWGPAAPEKPLPPNSFVFADDSVQVSRPIILDHQMIGSVCLRSDLSALRARKQSYALVFAGTVCGAALVALTLVSRLGRIISQPIVHLTETAKEIAA